MNRKTGEIIVGIILILLIILASLYLIDLNRMRKNEEVLFSTWGRDYQKNQTNENIIQNNQTMAEEEYFYGKVIESKQSYIIVEPNENEPIRKSADKISIGLGENNDALYMVGTNVKITYTGYVMETYPAKVRATKIELKSAEDFELRFYDKQPQNDTKVYKILDKEETDKYDYNVYTYDGSVNILINGEEISLRNALLENKITMEEIIAKANKDFPNTVSYRDGGSMEYHYDTYTIVKYHRLDGNRDVYIGPKGITINDVIDAI